jgi:hypothetical protein
MQKYVIPKLIGLSVLTMVVLVLISFLEVAVYSYLINPGQDQGVYEAHANASAPYISGIFGFIIFYFVARYWKKRRLPQLLKLVILFPLVYMILDVILITAAQADWSEFLIIFALANGAKTAGSLLGYALTK